MSDTRNRKESIRVNLPQGPKCTVLALGGDLKCRPALVHEGRAILLDEVGDLASPENQDALVDLVRETHPDIVVCDRHPGYFSHRLAHASAGEWGADLVEIQHHRAHVAAVCAEHGMFEEPVVGLAFDGTGYGDDGTAWGGEFFAGSVTGGFARWGHFAALPMPGGDAAVMEPWRSALALLIQRETAPAIIEKWIVDRRVPLNDIKTFERAVRRGFAVGRSTALGRWFDAASALLGICMKADFEAQPAIELQRAAERLEGEPAPWPVEVLEDSLFIIDFPAPERIAASDATGRNALAAGFHRAAARAAAEVAAHLAAELQTNKVVVSGGCFLNRLFDRLLAEGLSERNLEVTRPLALPPGDQALALGQIVLAQIGQPGVETPTDQ